MEWRLYKNIHKPKSTFTSFLNWLRFKHIKSIHDTKYSNFYKNRIVLLSTDIKTQTVQKFQGRLTFHNPYLRSTVTELQKFRDVFIRNTHVGISLVTVKCKRSLLPLCQISGTDFRCIDWICISVQGSLNNSEVIFQLFNTFKEHCNFWKKVMLCFMRAGRSRSFLGYIYLL